MKVSFFNRIRCFGLLALALVARSALGDTNLYSGDIWALVDSKNVMAAAAEMTLSNYPNCDEIVVEKKMERVYRADGTGEMQDETFTKALTEKGKRNNRTMTLSFMLPYSRCDVVVLEVIKPSGEVVPVDIAANSKETIDESQMSANIYDPNSRILQVNLPKVDVGDVVHSVARETIMRPIMPGEFAEENLFEGTAYIRHTTYEVHAPVGKPLNRIALRDEIPGTVKYSKEPDADGGTIHRWEVSNVPRMFDEPAMPPYEEVLQRLLVGTTPDWKTVSRWYWQLSLPHLDATTPEMKATNDQLTVSAKTDLDRVKDIFYYVSKNIRYMGLTPEKDRPGYEPHDVKITFDKKYGVCRDKAALLVSMLNNAGLHAFPVLIDVGAKRDQEVADPFFNHAIAAVELKKGEYTLMDPTDENTRELLPSYDCNRSYLICRPDGEDLQTSPIQPPDQHMMLIKTTGSLTAAGSLTAKSELEFNGVNDDEYRNAFSHMKPDDRQRFFERRLKAVMPGARLTSLQIMPEDMLDTSVKLRAVLEYSADGLTASGQGKSIVTVPWVGNDLGIVNFILDGTGLETRKYPMQIFVACGLREDISLKLEGGFKDAVSLPNCPAVDDSCSSYHETFSAKNNTLDCARETKLKVVEFSPAEYLKLKQELKDMQYDARKAPLMAVADSVPAGAALPAPAARSAIESDAQILDSRKELSVSDAHSATYKATYAKKILNYAGKIREAEFKVGYNPATEDAKLIRAVVVSKTGEKTEISAGEINIMDAGWNSSAKRYTGGKILVANLPGVDIGSSIEVEYQVTSTNKPFISGFESFQMPDALDQKSFHLTAPAGLALRQFVSGPQDGVKSASKNDEKGQTFDWTAQRASALPAEGQLPPAWAYNAGVSYFVGDMKGYLHDLNAAMLDRSSKSEKAAALARQLASQAKSQLAAAQAVRDYVARNIRLAGPSFTELPLSELSAADVTLSDGYGHAADRAILLHAMLTAAGLKPEFVLVSSLPPIDGITNVADTFPLPEWFQEPLVQVEINGVAYYLNDTDQYAELGSTPHDGMLGLRLAQQDINVIKSADNCADKVATDYAITPSDSGATRITLTRRYYGDNYQYKHKYFAELPPEERHRYYQEAVSGMAQGARPVGDLITQFDSYPGVEKFTVDVDNYSVVDGNYFYFDLPFAPSLFASGADTRALPLFLDHRHQNTVTAEIDLPSGFRRVVMAPGTLTLDGPDGSGVARLTTSQLNDKCAIDDDFETDPAIVKPKDYPEMLKVEAALGRRSSRLFLLEK